MNIKKVLATDWEKTWEAGPSNLPQKNSCSELLFEKSFFLTAFSPKNRPSVRSKDSRFSEKSLKQLPREKMDWG